MSRQDQMIIFADNIIDTERNSPNIRKSFKDNLEFLRQVDAIGYSIKNEP
jgi:hypothetical protein